MEKIGEQNGTESKTRQVEQINVCLRSGDYSRALDLLRGSALEFPNDAELQELEKAAQDGLKRKAEADRLITESQELFAQRKSAEAIQLLRKAYELDKRNSLARAILANALVEHAHSIVETDWLEAETLSNQALALNPAHPTAKTIRNLVVEQKKNSAVEEWVAQARKRQTSGDLFAALAWVAEGLAVHPEDPKLIQIQDEIQRDQGARRRQARRGDVEDLRRMEQEIAKAADVAAKQALAERIQAVAAKHWTDGEILSIANALLLRLGLVPQTGSSASSHRKGAAVIFHVPRPSAAEVPRANNMLAPPNPVAAKQVLPSPVLPEPVPPGKDPVKAVPGENVVSGVIAPSVVPASVVPANIVPASKVPANKVPPVKATGTAPETQPSPAKAPAAAEPSVRAVKATIAQAKRPERSNSTTLILVSLAAAIILVAAIFFLARRQQAEPVAKTPAAAPTVSVSTEPAPSVSAPAVAAPAQTTPEATSPAVPVPSDTPAEEITAGDQPPAESGHNVGTLIVVAAQDNARVFLNGKLQRQLTQAGQLRLPNLELKEYVVKVSKSGFQDPPQQTIHLRKGEEAKLVFNLQPQPGLAQPRLASLTIQGGAPGTAVLVDQTPVGTVQSDGTLSVSTINPGDHTVELRKERFKPRQLKKHFVAGGAISLAAADVALEAASGELKITFAPADAKVALVKGDLLTVVTSGVPLNLAAGTYTLTARTADSFTRSSTLEVMAGQSRTLDLALAPSGMSKWDNPGAWKKEGDSFIRKGGDFVLYNDGAASSTFVFSAMPAKGRLLQWVLNYSDPKNYVLFQMDENNFYRTVIHNGQKTDAIIVPHKGDKKSFRTLHVRVSATEIVHQVKQGYSWTVLDRCTQPGVNLGLGKFGFYIPGNDEVAVSSFAHYVDLNIH